MTAQVGQPRTTKSKYCRRCRVRIQALNCPRCGGLVESVPDREQRKPRHLTGERDTYIPMEYHLYDGARRRRSAEAE